MNAVKMYATCTSTCRVSAVAVYLAVLQFDIGNIYLS